MDTNTGRIYESFDEARKQNVAKASLVPVDVGAGFVTITGGPFRGRVYELNADGARGRRRRDKEKREGS